MISGGLPRSAAADPRSPAPAPSAGECPGSRGRSRRPARCDGPDSPSPPAVHPIVELDPLQEEQADPAREHGDRKDAGRRAVGCGVADRECVVVVVDQPRGRRQAAIHPSQGGVRERRHFGREFCYVRLELLARRQLDPTPLGSCCTASWTRALNFCRMPSGFAGTLCVISSVTISRAGSTQKIVPAVPSQPYSPRTGDEASRATLTLASPQPVDPPRSLRTSSGRPLPRHPLDRRALEHAHAVERALVEQHLRETEVIGHGGRPVPRRLRAARGVS